MVALKYLMYSNVGSQDSQLTVVLYCHLEVLSPLT